MLPLTAFNRSRVWAGLNGAGEQSPYPKQHCARGSKQLALHLAAHVGCWRCCALLLTAAPDCLNLRDRRDQTAASTAARRGHSVRRKYASETDSCSCNQALKRLLLCLCEIKLRHIQIYTWSIGGLGSTRSKARASIPIRVVAFLWGALAALRYKACCILLSGTAMTAWHNPSRCSLAQHCLDFELSGLVYFHIEVPRSSC